MGKSGAEADAFTKAVGHAGSIKHFKPHRQNDYLRNWLDQPGVGEPHQN